MVRRRWGMIAILGGEGLKIVGRYGRASARVGVNVGGGDCFLRSLE